MTPHDFQKKTDSESPRIIKNMRICIGEDTCRVTVYHGIDEVSMTTATIGDDKVYGQGADDENVTVVGKCKHYLEAVVRSLISYKNCGMESMEWDMGFYDSPDFEATSQFLMSRLKGIQLRVKKLVFNHNTPHHFINHVARFCSKLFLVAIDKRSVAPGAEYADPIHAMDVFSPNFWNGVTMRFSRIFLTKDSFNQVINYLILAARSVPHGAYVTYRARHKYPEDMYDLVDSKLHEGEHVKLQFIDGITLRHNLTSCGYWVTAIRESDEPYINWKSETCGLGEFCAKCAGSFEQDYFYGLPRRIVEDPDWIDVYCSILDKKERDGYFSKLSALVKNTPPLRVRRRTVEGFEAPSVNLLPLLSETATFIICALGTLAFYYFYPDLLDPRLPPILASLVFLAITLPESFLKTVLYRLLYSCLLAVSFLFFFPTLLNPKLVMFCALLIPWYTYLLLFFGYICLCCYYRRFFSYSELVSLSQ